MPDITVALAGNPNTGKTSLFNNLTGARQHVGNWPGVTVEKKEGMIKYKDHDVLIVDLPGTYSLGAYSDDELVARRFIVNNNPDAIINVIDSTNLHRNLYLTVQMIEMGANVIIALNMMDEANKDGILIDNEKLSMMLGVPIIPTIASKGKGIDRIMEAAVENNPKTAQVQKANDRIIDYGSNIEHEITRLEQVICSCIPNDCKYPSRWLAIKLLEDDTAITEYINGLSFSSKINDAVYKSRSSLEKSLGSHVESAIISKRYEYIDHIIKNCVSAPPATLTITDKIDRIVTHKIFGIPIFLLIMGLIFAFTFKLSAPIVDMVEGGFQSLAKSSELWLSNINTSKIFTSFIVDGIIGGLGTVLGVLPVLVMLFLALSVLEDSGYMARAAYIMDTPMKKIGLHGKAFIPFLLGFGCNVPAIMSTRTLDNDRDKLIAILSNPFMSCTARLPIYVLFTSVFFSGHQVPVILSLYFIGILMAVLTAKLFGKYVTPDDDSELIMELPPYRIPTLKGMFIHMWENISSFLKKVSTIILSAVIIIWLLSSLPYGVEYASSQSIIGIVSSKIAPILKPAGFGSWQAAISLIFGVLAKEIVVSTLGIVCNGSGQKLTAVLSQHFTPLSAYAFMVMALLYSPCIATIGAIRSETKSVKWTIFTLVYGFAVAWTLSVLIYQIGMILGFK